MAHALFMGMRTHFSLKLFVIENTKQICDLVDLLYTTSSSDPLEWILVLMFLYLLLCSADMAQFTKRDVHYD